MPGRVKGGDMACVRGPLGAFSGHALPLWSDLRTEVEPRIEVRPLSSLRAHTCQPRLAANLPFDVWFYFDLRTAKSTTYSEQELDNMGVFNIRVKGNGQGEQGLYGLILETLESHDGYCMDEESERIALAYALCYRLAKDEIDRAYR